MFSGVLSLLTAEMLANSGHILSDDPENAVRVGFMTVRTMLAFILSNKLASFVIINMVCIWKNKNINGDLSSAYVKVLSKTRFLFLLYKPTRRRDLCAELLVFS